MPRSMVGTMVDNFKIVLPYFKPIRGILVAFCITGYLIYKIPISGKGVIYARMLLMDTVLFHLHSAIYVQLYLQNWDAYCLLRESEI